MTAAPEYPAVNSDLVSRQILDVDPEETEEWRESLAGVVHHAGRDRARHLELSVLQRARERQVDVSGLSSTAYINTIPPEAEPTFPGDERIEQRIRTYIRWNASIMGHRAQRPGVDVGGHISTYASSASLYEAGFDHFFRGHGAAGGADQHYVQGRASPGIYARAYLEGRLSQDRLDGFRQELSHSGPGGGLPSYPHPRLMPDFWEFPTVSMGLGPSTRSTTPGSTATCTPAVSPTRADNGCGPYSGTARWTSRSPSTPSPPRPDTWMGAPDEERPRHE